MCLDAFRAPCEKRFGAPTTQICCVPSLPGLCEFQRKEITRKNPRSDTTSSCAFMCGKRQSHQVESGSCGSAVDLHTTTATFRFNRERDWRPETAKEKIAQIEADYCAGKAFYFTPWMRSSSAAMQIRPELGRMLLEAQTKAEALFHGVEGSLVRR